MLFSLSLVLILGLMVLQLTLAIRMGREVSVYAVGALAEKTPGIRVAGQVIGFLIGYLLWLPLMLFSLAAFRSSRPVTRGGLVPRRL